MLRAEDDVNDGDDTADDGSGQRKRARTAVEAPAVEAVREVLCLSHWYEWHITPRRLQAALSSNVHRDEFCLLSDEFCLHLYNVTSSVF